MVSELPKKGFHLISFETRFGKVPLFIDETFDSGAKASVIIGPNGSGKSQVLAAICNELTNIHQIHNLRTKKSEEPQLSRRLRMINIDESVPVVPAAFNEAKEVVTDFESRIVYWMDEVIWDIQRDARSLTILRNGEPSDIYELDFPDKVLAIAYLPIDKFRFSKRSDGQFYRYLGLRQSNNMTSTGALGTKALLNFLETFDKPAGPSIQEHWLPELGLALPIFAEIEIKPIKLLGANNFDHFRHLCLDNLVRNVGSARAEVLWEDEAVAAKIEHVWPTFETFRTILQEGRRTGRRNRFFLLELMSGLQEAGGNFAGLAEFLRLGRELKFVGKLGLCFSKNGNLVPFDDLSSGEQHILSTVTQLIANLGEKTVAFIDEPEISLHPDWQRQYIPSLLESLAKNPSTHAIIATHSHFIVSDIKEATGSLTTAKDSEDGAFETYDGEVYGRSADNILYRVFGVASTGNRFVEHDLATALKMISGTGNLDLSQLRAITKRLRPLAAKDNPALTEILNSIDSYLGRSDNA